MGRWDQLKTDIGDFRVEFLRPGESAISGDRLWRVGKVVVAIVIVATNLVGAAAVTLIVALVVPLPAVANLGHVEVVNFLTAAAYVIAAVLVGFLVGVGRLMSLRRWLLEERPADTAEQLVVLRAPLRLFVVQIALWIAAAVLFGVLDSTYDVALGLRVGATVALTGVSTAACAYLLTERMLRSASARALARGAPERLAVPGSPRAHFWHGPSARGYLLSVSSRSGWSSSPAAARRPRSSPRR